MPQVEKKLFKVPEDSPDRCQSVIRSGQCPFKAVEGFKYCPMHITGTMAGIAGRERNKIYNLRL